MSRRERPTGQSLSSFTSTSRDSGLGDDCVGPSFLDLPNVVPMNGPFPGRPRWRNQWIPVLVIPGRNATPW